MTDLDRLLDEASSDVRRSVRRKGSASPVTFRRKSHRRAFVLAVTSVLAVGATAILVTGDQRGLGPLQGSGTRITSEVILSDGVVSEAEYRAGADAVVSCLADAGVGAELEYGTDRHASFFIPDDGTNEVHRSNEQLQQCRDLHLSDNVALGWAATLGQVDLEQHRFETTARVACVEERAGTDFGELTFDRFGYLTEQGRQTKHAAMELQDHRLWEACGEELGVSQGTDSPEASDEDLSGTAAVRELISRGGLTLAIRGPVDRRCLEVRSGEGMAGGCGVDLDQELHLGTGSLDGVAFVDGWAPANAASVVITLADGTEFEATELVSVADFDVQFYLEVLPPTDGGEPELPIEATAVDSDGLVISRFQLRGPTEGAPNSTP